MLTKGCEFLGFDDIMAGGGVKFYEDPGLDEEEERRRLEAERKRLLAEALAAEEAR